MKKIISMVLISVMALTLVACGGSGASKMTMGTGGTAGTYYGYGGVLGQYIKNKAGINVTVVSTDGSKANIQGIDAGNYQLGTVQSDVMSYAWEGIRSFEKEGKVAEANEKIELARQAEDNAEKQEARAASTREQISWRISSIKSPPIRSMVKNRTVFPSASDHSAILKHQTFLQFTFHSLRK